MNATFGLQKATRIVGGDSLATQYTPRYLSSNVGRKQYPLLSNISLYTDKCKKMELDWHSMKCLEPLELKHLLDDEFQMNVSEKSVLLKALEKKVCGVVCQSESSSTHSTNICLKRGLRSHGWRCGDQGHLNDVYFEGKGPANALTRISRPSLASRGSSGVQTIIHSEPDFTIAGRYSDQLQPRVWNAPKNPQFLVDVLGYEFRVHPKDSRAPTQIVAAAGEWELHAEVVKQIVWEMLELHAIEREPQPLELNPGELGRPDFPNDFSRAFNVTLDGESQTVVEHKMARADGGTSPWFIPPENQKFNDGIPSILPFCPSIVIKSSFRKISRFASVEVQERLLLQPVMDISVFIHPQSCFFWSSTDEHNCILQILNFAKRLPYVIPFYLYFRVDSSLASRKDPTLTEKKQRLLDSKREYFNIRNFCN